MNELSSPENINITMKKQEKPANSDSKPYYVFFIFVNPTSGGNKAAVLTKLDVENMLFPVFNKDQAKVEVNFHDLKDTRSREVGFRNLKSKQKEEGLDIRVIVGGGDGTIIWVIEEMIKAHISFDNCPIGCIPFGTGNDFSRVLGWGGQEPNVLIGPHFNNLKGLIKNWIDAVPQDFDIWEITFEVYEEGGIKRVLKDGTKAFEKKFIVELNPSTGEEKKVLKLTKKMCNYYSFGIDARIGFGFDKSRTTSRAKNKMVYCWEGVKKLFLKTLKVNHILHTVHHDKEDSLKIEQEGQEEPNIDKIEYKGNEFVLYPSTPGNTRPKNASVIKGNPSVFLCLNIPSYMAGASNPWASAKGKVGVTDDQNKTLIDFEDQRIGDGKLEIISFSSSMSLAMERLVHGQGRRIGQAEGPFVLNFIRSENREKPLVTYMQIDGEFFQLVAPRSVRIRPCRDLPNGKVRVLMNANAKKK